MVKSSKSQNSSDRARERAESEETMEVSEGAAGCDPQPVSHEQEIADLRKQMDAILKMATAANERATRAENAKLSLERQLNAFGASEQGVQPSSSDQATEPMNITDQWIHRQSPNMTLQSPGATAAANHGERGGLSNLQYEIPLPRCCVFDGKMTWDSFYQPFLSMSIACAWSENEKLFRLTSCLRGEAAEYAFNQLAPDVLSNYDLLVFALENRFKEKLAITSYLARLENRRLNPKEKLSEYIADIQKLVNKGYPSADAITRDTITMRHFIKGLVDPNAILAVGMNGPSTVIEARDAYETYMSLRDDLVKTQPQRIRALKEDSYVTETSFEENMTLA